MPQILNYVMEILVLCYETQCPFLNYKTNVFCLFFLWQGIYQIKFSMKVPSFLRYMWLWCQFSLQHVYSVIQINPICQLMINYSLMLWVTMWLSSSIDRCVLLRERCMHSKLWTKFRWFYTTSQDFSLEFSPLCNISDISGPLECSFPVLWPESWDLGFFPLWLISHQCGCIWNEKIERQRKKNSNGNSVQYLMATTVLDR